MNDNEYAVDGEILKMQYQVTMEDGSVWGVPVLEIALNRARHYADVDEVPLNESLNDDTIPLFMSDEFEIEDWAKNNMDWADVFTVAVNVTGPVGVDFEESWVNGDVRVART